MDKKVLKMLEEYFQSSIEGMAKRDFAYKYDLSKYEYAIKSGYMFYPRKFTHHEIIEKVTRIVSRIKLKDVTKAFVASLSTRRLDLRSALGSYICALNLPPHPPTQTIFAASCGVCGMILQKTFEEDLNNFSYARYKCGGVRHLNPAYELFDLEQFKISEKLEPNINDYLILENIISTIESLPDNAKLNDLVRALKNVLPSNSEERRVLIEILGYCGILETEKHKGFIKEYTDFDCREMPPVNKTDWEYPVMWWRGKNRINKTNYKDIFLQGVS